MKIAILISGHLRSFLVEKVGESIIENIIIPNQNFDFNFFVSTWDNLCYRIDTKIYGNITLF